MIWHLVGPPFFTGRQLALLTVLELRGVRGGDNIVDIVPRLIVNSIDATIAAAEAGVGFANVLSYQSAPRIANGQLVEVLADHAPTPMPVSLLYDPGRAAMPAVRVFIEAMREQGRQRAWS